MFQHLHWSTIGTVWHVPGRQARVDPAGRQLVLLEQRVGFLSILDSLLLLEWFLVVPSGPLPQAVLGAFVLAAVINLLICASIIRAERTSPRVTRIETMSRIRTMGEKLVFVDEVIRRNGLVAAAIAATILVNMLALSVLVW